MPKCLNNDAWEQLFSKYNILNKVDKEGQFVISADQIKEFREPRLMAKFDHSINLPKLFAKNQLAILPIARGEYVISHFEAYHKFETAISPSIIKVNLPGYLQSLDTNNITSETMALNCAIATGIIADFLEDEGLLATVSGRMGSGKFGFNIKNSKSGVLCPVYVSNSQIEIDAAYEGINGLALFEAKRDISDDFLIRQLYYPYRVWKCRVTKPVRPLFLVYSNDIFHLYEYQFQDKNNYNSLQLIKQKNYSIEDTSITIEDIQNVLHSTTLISEPEISFPQADKFERIINLCELLKERNLSRNEITEQYEFDVRQTSYYTDAALYLGLIEKTRENRVPIYRLNNEGKRILCMNYKQRQLAYCAKILSHKVFADVLQRYFDSGKTPSEEEIILLMKSYNLYRVKSESTFKRRRSTITGWINWIVGLANE